VPKTKRKIEPRAVSCDHQRHTRMFCHDAITTFYGRVFCVAIVVVVAKDVGEVDV
jgi:hypothetical protein